MKGRSNARLRQAGALIASSLTARDLWAQCAMCGKAAESSGIGRGLSISVLFLLGTVTVLALGLVVLMVRARSRQTRDAITGK